MPDYQKMYFQLFNAIIHALENLKKQNYGLAAKCLKSAQIDVENAYLTTEDAMTIVE